MNNELPYQTYERVTGKKWTGGNSADVQSAYKQYGITAPAGSAEANLALQKAMKSTPIKAPTVVSSETARDITKENINTVNNYSSNIGYTGRMDYSTNPNGVRIPVDPRTGKDLDIPTDTTTTKPPSNPLTQNIKDAADEISVLRGRISSQNQALIDSLSRQFDELYRKQEIANKNYEGVITQAGIHSNRQRYASELYAGENKVAVEQGISKLTDIVNKKNDAIIRAQNAKDEKDYEMLNKQVSIYNDLITQERQATQDLIKNTIEWNKEIREQQKFTRTEEEATIKSLAPSVLSIIEQNPDQYDDLIMSIAQEYGVDAQKLAGAVEAQRLNITKANPTSLDEYNLYLSQGGSGSFIDFMAAKKKANTAVKSSSSGPISGVASILTPEEADALGISRNIGLVGKTDIEILSELNKSEPPQWFKDMVKQQEPTKKIKDRAWPSIWQGFKQDPEVSKYIIDTTMAKNKSVTTPSSGSIKISI